MQERPLVSILMTAFNREEFLKEAIVSVLASTYDNFELIIVDDCSSDNSVEIIKHYARSDPRIRFYQNEKNLGDYPNRNRAASYAKGEWLMSVDSDDSLVRTSIWDSVKLMNQYPDVKYASEQFEERDGLKIIKSTDAIRQHFFQKPFLFHGPGGTIVNRKFFFELGGYPEKYGPANDMYFNLKAASKTDIALLPFRLIYYRRHEGQQINNSYGYLFNNYGYLRDALNELQLPIGPKEKEWLIKKNKRRFAVNIAKYFSKTFNFRKTANAIRLANFSFKDAMQGIFHL